MAALYLGLAGPSHAQGAGESRAEKLETFLKSWMSAGTNSADAKPRPGGPGFLWRRMDDPQPFAQPLGRDPEKICDRLDEAGFGNLGWRQAEYGATDWECVVISNVLTSGADSNSLFYQLRGKTRLRLSFARVKINVPQAGDRMRTAAKASQFVEVFAKSVGMEASEQARRSIEALQPGRFLTDAATYTLKQEATDQQRFNLSIEMGRPLRAFIPVSLLNGSTITAIPVTTSSPTPKEKRSRLRAVR